MDRGEQLVKVVDPRLNLVAHESIATVAVEGAAAAAVYIFPRQEAADNPASDIVSKQCTFPIVTQAGSIISRRAELYQKYRVKITRTIAAKGGRAFVANAVAPRAFVNHAIMGTITANVNNLSYSWQPSRSGQLMQVNGTQLQKYSSGAPYIFDCSSDWNALLTSNRNVLANINNSSTGDYYRGAYVSVIANPAAGADGVEVTCELEFESTEPLMCPPFQWTGPQDAGAGLAHVSTAQVICQLAPNYKRAICLASGAMPVADESKVKVYIVESSLRVTMFTPQPTVPIPPEVYYSVPLQTLVQNAIGVVQPSLTNDASPITENSFTSNVVTCTGMPSLIAAWVAPTNGLSTTPYYDTDWSCGIVGASVNLGSTVAAFNTYSAAQLYQLALNHKWCRSFMEYRGYVQMTAQAGAATTSKGLIGTSGGILLFDPSDVGITNYVTGGTSGAYNLSVTLRYINQSAVAQDLTLYMVCFYENSWKLTGASQSKSSQPTIDAAKILDAPNVTDDAPVTMGGDDMLGSGWIDSAKSALRLGKKYAGYAKDGLNALDKAGLLKGEGSYSGAGRVTGAGTGGAVISKPKLARALAKK